MEKNSVLKWRRESVLDLYIMAGGLFLLLSPWLFGLVRRSGIIDAEVIGCLIVAISIVAIVAFAAWEEWINLALGIWLIAAPWVLGFAHTSAMHVSIGVGIVVAYLALLDLWLVHERRARGPDASNAPGAYS